MLLRLPDPPLALLNTGEDPDDIVGGIFDRRIFDGFKPNYVFDTAAPATRLIADPDAGNMVTGADPPVLSAIAGEYEADEYAASDFEIGYDPFVLIPDPVVVPMVTTPDPVA